MQITKNEQAFCAMNRELKDNTNSINSYSNTLQKLLFLLASAPLFLLANSLESRSELRQECHRFELEFKSKEN